MKGTQHRHQKTSNTTPVHIIIIINRQYSARRRMVHRRHREKEESQKLYCMTFLLRTLPDFVDGGAYSRAATKANDFQFDPPQSNTFLCLRTTYHAVPCTRYRANQHISHHMM